MSFEKLSEKLRPAHDALIAHPLYGTLREPSNLRRFVTVHAFAVWDFMSLLKTLQQRLTTTSIPWTPPQHPKAARLINEIVLGEESDEITPGHPTSHFELYLLAMRELDANRAPIEMLIAQLSSKNTAESETLVSDPRAQVAEALSKVSAIHGAVMPGVVPFVDQTFALAKGATIGVAAAFLLGRERLVPAMFEEMLHGIGAVHAPNFRLYLERHVHLDGEQHGPMAIELLKLLCGDNGDCWQQAEEAALLALKARHALWDAVHAGQTPVARA